LQLAKAPKDAPITCNLFSSVCDPHEVNKLFALKSSAAKKTSTRSTKGARSAPDWNLVVREDFRFHMTTS
jgi:hypothetical protein